MPLPFNSLEHIGISLLNQGPGPMADLLGVLSFKALIAAIHLNIFEIVGHDAVTPETLARTSGADAVGLSYLVGVLKNLGYLKERRGRISNTAMVKKWFLRSSPNAMVDLFESINDAAARWDYLPDSLSRGRPPRLGYQWLDGDESRWTRYHRGLKSTASLLAPTILQKVRIPNRRGTLLDLGGSHGHYCIQFCRRYPGLSGIIIDWEPAGPVALQNIRDAGLGDRISFKACDFIKDDIGCGYDVILMFNVIRIHEADELFSLLKKVFNALSDGGLVVILDHMGYIPGSRFMGANAFLILLELYNSTIGRIHKASDVSRMLGDAGFSGISKKNLARSPGLTLVQARRS